ncbi:hypothetical protein [uncultured Desulfobacter sp.]|uniref:hypothetical protein n=1 Tax=uncultured Desulfobacter sp. TaxID=240139 RepID=UPI002AAB763F|nr:hypothetical protein [uncultured Desulfobacter sp.]
MCCFRVRNGYCISIWFYLNSRHKFPFVLGRAIARALSVSPELLICDEVLCGLDLPLQVDIMAHLTSIQESSNMALLFISHDIGSISRVCSRIVHLGGKNNVAAS